ncbi:MAG TPA: heme-binding domain-containing protein [Kofleriaceae bacterium]|nr:heme-binding domain-containing protein [Kofleriaceae bacterium]
MRSRKILLGILGSLIGILVLAQLVPYGRDHSNPRVVAEPSWNLTSTRDLAKRACFDCHSNETAWPWYSHVAPISWLVQHDVDEGRDVLNFSDWSRSYEEAGEAAGTVLDNEMPPASYTILHPEARLSVNEKRQLADGLRATLGTTPADD